MLILLKLSTGKYLGKRMNFNYSNYPEQYKIGWRYILWHGDIPHWIVNKDYAIEEFNKVIKLVSNDKVILVKLKKRNGDRTQATPSNLSVRD